MLAIRVQSTSVDDAVGEQDYGKMDLEEEARRCKHIMG
jgi:hypothetical protein